MSSERSVNVEDGDRMSESRELRLRNYVRARHVRTSRVVIDKERVLDQGRRVTP